MIILQRWCHVKDIHDIFGGWSLLNTLSLGGGWFEGYLKLGSMQYGCIWEIVKNTCILTIVLELILVIAVVQQFRVFCNRYYQNSLDYQKQWRLQNLICCKYSERYKMAACL